MGLYINKQESRSELQERIAAELRAKAEQKAKDEAEYIAGRGGKKKDEVEDSAYMKGYKKTTTLAPVWLMIFFAAILVFIYFITQVSK